MKLCALVIGHKKASQGAVNKSSGNSEFRFNDYLSRDIEEKVLQKNLVTALGLINRGIKPKNAEDRGGYLLNNTESPCLISEPFFIDNNKDLAVASKKWHQLVNGDVKSTEGMSSLLEQ